MSQQPISVVIPSYNRARLIARAVDSVLAAALPGDEVIIVDDGSTDNTQQVLQQYGDRIRRVAGRHAGAGAARNLGIANASHSLIAFLDSDDEWAPDKLYLQRAVMAHMPDITFCFSDFTCRSPNAPDQPHASAAWHKDFRPWSEILGPSVPFSQIAPLPKGREDFQVHKGAALYSLEMFENYIAAFTLLVRRPLAGDALHFPEDLPTYEDWECFGRLSRNATCAYLACDTATQWGHAGPRLTNASHFTNATVRLKILDRVWGSDLPFLANPRHAADLDKLLAEQHLIRTRALLHDGRMSEAREELTQVPRSPLLYKVLAMMPAIACKAMLAAYSWTALFSDV